MSLEILFDDLIYHIISISNIQDIFRLSYVNKRFNRITQDILLTRDLTVYDGLEKQLVNIHINNLHKVHKKYHKNIICECTSESRTTSILQTIDTYNIYGFIVKYTNHLSKEFLDCMSNAKYICINNNNKLDYITNILMLNNVRYLSINNVNINDISMLTKVTHLSVSSTNVTEVNMLTQLIELNINNTKVNDVSKLVNLKKLYASESLIKDVSMLINLECLYIHNTEIKDINTLINLTQLSMERTPIEDISMLTTLTYLSACNTNLKYINNLVNLKRIYVNNTLIDCVDNLTNINDININNTMCVNVIINNVKIIDNINLTNILYCENIKINKIDELFVSNLPKLVNISGFIQILIIDYCDILQDVNINNDMRLIQIFSCKNMKYININNNNIHRVNIDECPIIQLSGVTNVRSLSITHARYSRDRIILTRGNDKCILSDIRQGIIKVNNIIIYEPHRIEILNYINTISITKEKDIANEEDMTKYTID